MIKNIVLFGAGASYGSDSNNTPPLGNALFHELTKFYPNTWGSIHKEIQLQFENDFELGMKNFASKYPFRLPEFQRNMASYFFNFRPYETSLYYRLATDLKINYKDVVFTSLNYDTLLKQSFRKAGFDLVFNKQDVSQFELNLPHGCCNLFCDSVIALNKFVKMDGLDVKINGSERFVDSGLEFMKRITENEIPPVMSYFEPSKVTMAGEQFLFSQRDRYKQLIDLAEQVIVIGVKIREHDSHIWDPIKSAKCKFVYCSGLSEADSYNSWVRTNRSGLENVFISGFWAEKYDEIFTCLI